MKIRRTELEGLQKVFEQGGNVRNKAFARALFLNHNKVLSKLKDIDVYRRKTYETSIKVSKANGDNLDLEKAEKILDKFRYEFIPNLVEKYSWYGEGKDKESKQQYKVNGQPHVHPTNMTLYEVTADKEYKRTEAEVKKDYPKEYSLLEELNQKSENYMNKETTIGFVKVSYDQLPETFSARDMETFIFMIDIKEDEEA